MALPSNISYGTVVGQFIASIADGPDADTLPESVPCAGTVTFVASAPYVLDYSATPNPVTVVKTPIVCQLDDQGYLCSPYPLVAPFTRGVTLVATDDPDLQPVGWNWNVVYNLTDSVGNKVSIPNQSIKVATGATVDLTTAMPVANSNGVMITKGDPGIKTVVHGTNGAMARPDTLGLVQWVGSAKPVNALPYDWWLSV